MLSPGEPKDEHLSCWQEGEFQQQLLKAELLFLPPKLRLSKRETNPPLGLEIMGRKVMFFPHTTSLFEASAFPSRDTLYIYMNDVLTLQ